MKKKNAIKRIAALALTAFGLTILPSFSAHAVSGWTDASGNWQCLDRSNQPVTERWAESRGYWYYLGSDGFMVKDRIFSWAGGNYYTDENGRMVSNAWIYIDAAKDPAGEFEEGYYYFGVDGRAYVKDGARFRRLIDGKYYIFNELGRMMTGFLNAEGTPVESEEKFTEAVFYAAEDGHVYTNEWLNYGSVGETDGIGGSAIESAISGRSYSDYNELWMFFDSSSRKIHSTESVLKQRNIDGSRYAFDEHGIMVPWWSLASVSDADRSNPTSTNEIKYFSGFDGGTLLKNKWFWMYPSENLNATDFTDQGSSWWYAGADGNVVRNRIKNIGGKSYAFDGIGRMQTGFVIYNNTERKFVVSYDTDDWSSSDFISGAILGGNANDLYLFSPNELNDGSMQTGELEVELEDGIFTFGFAANGKAFGNQDHVQKQNGKYYLNGLRLEANPDMGYGIVAVTQENEADIYETLYYQVVDTEGNIVRGNKKLVQDRDGSYLIIMGDRFAGYVDSGNKPKWAKVGAVEGYYEYDSSDKENPYKRFYIGSMTNTPDISNIPAELSINFE